jgi:hypothetical protein
MPISVVDPNGSVADFISFAFLYQVPVFVSGMLLVYINTDAIRHSCAASKIWARALRGSPYLAVTILLAAAASGNRLGYRLSYAIGPRNRPTETTYPFAVNVVALHRFAWTSLACKRTHSEGMLRDQYRETLSAWQTAGILTLLR